MRQENCRQIVANPWSRIGTRIVLVLILVLVRAVSVDAADPGLPRPNIVLIIADDLGCDDCGPYGNRAVRTPSLDRLAREGLRFQQAFLTCSSCSPSRASLITSRYPHSTGAAELHQPVPAIQVTFVEQLRAAGYWTAAAGKWHLGPALRSRFDKIAEAGAQLPAGVRRDGSGCEQWLPTLAQRPASQPFFLWLAAVDPHRDYAADTIAEPHRPDSVVVPPYLPDTPAVRRDLALYYDEISRLDGYLGRMLEALDQAGLTENTLVLFMTDNGRPFPRCKTTVYDSGIRTPLIARWPARIRGGTTCEALVSSLDIGPTLVELAGGTCPDSFQGQSFARLLEDPSRSFRDHVIAEHNWHDYRARERAVRTREYKMIVNALPELPGTPPADAVRGATFQEMRRLERSGQLHASQRSVFVTPRPAVELYDVVRDPHELQNLAATPEYEPTVRRLRSVLEQWSRETGDVPPPTLTADKFDRETGAKLSP